MEWSLIKLRDKFFYRRPRTHYGEMLARFLQGGDGWEGDARARGGQQFPEKTNSSHSAD
jgi:hypothetical protein